MAIHNKSYNNHALMSLNKMRKEESLKNKTSSDFEMPAEIKLLHSISDCGVFLKQLPDKSIQLICIDPRIIWNWQGGIFTKIISNGHQNGLMRHIEFYPIMEVWLFLAVYSLEMQNQEIC